MYYKGILLAILMNLGQQTSDETLIRVLQSNDRGVLAEPMVTPQFTFRLESGQTTRGLHVCKQRADERERDGFRYPVMVLECDDGSVMVLTGIALGIKK